MRRIKKLMTAVLLLCMTMCFAGCGEEKLVSEDFNRANPANYSMNPIMKTDTGYYYNDSKFKDLNLHYYDAENGKSMYLCNKPECRHDGNEFCAATSDKYKVIDTVMYSGSIFISVVEETQSSYDFKLLKASADGSSLSELVTFFSTDNIALMPIQNYKPVKNMAIHRNKAFLPYTLANEKYGEVGINGTAIYDLETGELTYLGEPDGDLASQDGKFCGFGDYMYFVTSQKYKTELYRYSYDVGSVEKVELKMGFKGNYTIFDENTIFYNRGIGELWMYHEDTKENMQIDIEDFWGYWEEIETKDGKERHQIGGSSWLDILSDGEYVYVSDGFSYDICHKINEQEIESLNKTMDFAEVIILDNQGNLVNEVRFSPKYMLGYQDYYNLHFVDNTVYMQTPVMVYECSRADFIAGNANFKECYPIDINIRSAKELE